MPGFELSNRMTAVCLLYIPLHVLLGAVSCIQQIIAAVQ